MVPVQNNVIVFVLSNMEEIITGLSGTGPAKQVCYSEISPLSLRVECVCLRCERVCAPELTCTVWRVCVPAL